jgi:hypothetical protein
MGENRREKEVKMKEEMEEKGNPSCPAARWETEVRRITLPLGMEKLEVMLSRKSHRSFKSPCSMRLITT